MLIQVPPKIRRPKVKNRYIFPDYAYDIDERVFDFQHYNKAVYKPEQSWEEGKCTDEITFNAKEHNEELQKHTKLNSSVIPEIM